MPKAGSTLVQIRSLYVHILPDLGIEVRAFDRSSMHFIHRSHALLFLHFLYFHNAMLSSHVHHHATERTRLHAHVCTRWGAICIHHHTRHNTAHTSTTPRDTAGTAATKKYIICNRHMGSIYARGTTATVHSCSCIPGRTYLTLMEIQTLTTLAHRQVQKSELGPRAWDLAEKR